MTDSLSVLDDVQMKDLLRCPDCRAGTLIAKGVELVCPNCTLTFPLVNNRPVLLRHDNPLFSIDEYRGTSSEVAHKKRWAALFKPSPSVNLASRRVLATLRSLLDAEGIQRVLVVGGGRQRTWLDPLLCANRPHQVVYSDIDNKSDVDLFCDGHELPFVDAAFDAIVTTAVLEHVLYPERVAAEIARVLRTGGLLYSEMPFMQQVHEGAYDFTRYTLSGHRRLFNQFSEIDSGMVAGPATAFVWATENLALAFSSSAFVRSAIKIVIRLTVGWVKYLDLFLARRPEAMDGASCTYLLGRKAEKQRSDSNIISHYVGAKHLSHV